MRGGSVFSIRFPNVAARPQPRIGRTAALAGLLLAVQAALLAFSLGASAAPPMRDRFGNVLCATSASGDHGAPSDPGERHGGRLDCCTAGCPIAGGGLAPPAVPALPTPYPLLASRLAFALHENAAGAGVPASPRSARAPPVPV